MHSSLNIILTAFTPREAIAFYLLVSYLKKCRANNDNLRNEIFEFCSEFLQNLNSFSIYDAKPPEGMSKELFSAYKRYKEESKILTTAESLTQRLEIMISEFDRLYQIISRDKKRLHDAEQKRILFFRQKGLCGECRKEMRFNNASSHHIIAHSKGGSTTDLGNAVLLHDRCHVRIERRLKKNKEKLKQENLDIFE